MNKELEKEYEKLGDLEFEYNLISKFANNEEESEEALKKLGEQIKKIKDMEESIPNEESNIKAQE